MTVEPRYSYKQKLTEQNPGYTRKVLGTLADFILAYHSKPAVQQESEELKKIKQQLEVKDREIAELKYQLDRYKSGSDTTKILSPIATSFRSANKSLFEDNWPASEIKERPSLRSQSILSNISIDRGRSSSISISVERFSKNSQRISKSPARQLLDKLLTKIDKRLPQDRSDDSAGFRPPLTPIKKNS
jgi:hypothetical protein